MPEFSLHARQRLADGLRDAALQQFDQAIAGLTEGGDIDPAIHEARKAMKRIRAMLRLVRPVISHDVYRAETGILRDTARIPSSTQKLPAKSSQDTFMGVIPQPVRKIQGAL